MSDLLLGDLTLPQSPHVNIQWAWNTSPVPSIRDSFQTQLLETPSPTFLPPVALGRSVVVYPSVSNPFQSASDCLVRINELLQSAEKALKKIKKALAKPPEETSNYLIATFISNYNQAVRAFNASSQEVAAYYKQVSRLHEQILTAHGVLCGLFYQALNELAPFKQQESHLTSRWHLLIDTLLDTRFALLWMSVVSPSAIAEPVQPFCSHLIPMTVSATCTSVHLQSYVTRLKQAVEQAINKSKNSPMEKQKIVFHSYKRLWDLFSVKEFGWIESGIKRVVSEYNQEINALKDSLISQIDIDSLSQRARQEIVDAILSDQKSQSTSIEDKQAEREILLTRWHTIVSLLQDTRLALLDLQKITGGGGGLYFAGYLYSWVSGEGNEAISLTVSTDWVTKELHLAGSGGLVMREAPFRSIQMGKANYATASHLEAARLQYPDFLLHAFSNIESLLVTAKQTVGIIKKYTPDWIIGKSPANCSYNEVKNQYSQFLGRSNALFLDLADSVRWLDQERQRLSSKEDHGLSCISRKHDCRGVNMALELEYARLQGLWTELLLEVDRIKRELEWVNFHTSKERICVLGVPISLLLPDVTKNGVEEKIWLQGQIQLTILYARQINEAVKRVMATASQESFKNEFSFYHYLWNQLIHRDFIPSVEYLLKQYAKSTSEMISTLSGGLMAHEWPEKLEKISLKGVLEALMYESKTEEKRRNSYKNDLQETLKAWDLAITSLELARGQLLVLHTQSQANGFLASLSGSISGLGSWIVGGQQEPVAPLELDKIWFQRYLNF